MRRAFLEQCQTTYILIMQLIKISESKNRAFLKECQNHSAPVVNHIECLFYFIPFHHLKETRKMQKTPALQKSMGKNIETKEKSPVLYFTPPPIPTMDGCINLYFILIYSNHISNGTLFRHLSCHYLTGTPFHIWLSATSEQSVKSLL